MEPAHHPVYIQLEAKTSEESLWPAPLSLVMRPPHLRKVVGAQTKEKVVPGDLSPAPYCPSINGRLVVPCMHFRNKLTAIPEIKEELQYLLKMEDS